VIAGYSSGGTPIGQTAVPTIALLAVPNFHCWSNSDLRLASFLQVAIFLIGRERMHRLLLLVIAGATVGWTVTAAADNNLHGTYAFTGMSSCIQDQASSGFNPNLTPKGPTDFFTFSVEGTRTFHADGTGIVRGRAVSIDPPPNASASSDDFSFKFTYTVDPGGKLSTSLVPGSFSATVLTGPRAGQSYVDDVPIQSGFIGEGAGTIVLHEQVPTVESHSFSNGDMFLRICNRSRTLIRVRDGDE